MHSNQSISISWQELGMNTNVSKLEYSRIKWFEILDWLDDNHQFSYRISKTGVWFFSSQDAVLFKLRWAGMLYI